MNNNVCCEAKELATQIRSIANDINRVLFNQ